MVFCFFLNCTSGLPIRHSHTVFNTFATPKTHESRLSSQLSHISMENHISCRSSDSSQIHSFRTRFHCSITAFYMATDCTSSTRIGKRISIHSFACSLKNTQVSNYPQKLVSKGSEHIFILLLLHRLAYYICRDDFFL